MKAQKSTIRQRFWQWAQNFSRRGSRGLGIKRWMLVILTGITLLGVGLGILLLEIYRTNTSSSAILTFLSVASLRFLPRILRVVIFGGLGIGLVVYGIWGLNRSLFATVPEAWAHGDRSAFRFPPS